ncbi:hypothetical protein F6P96_22940 (plasmid) [Escherichia coli]|nr:hypothetical protein F6P96_22940 [Escherichia coli]
MHSKTPYQWRSSQSPLISGTGYLVDDGFRDLIPWELYFYWNEETEFLLESWLTYPSYPYGWLS